MEGPGEFQPTFMNPRREVAQSRPEDSKEQSTEKGAGEADTERQRHQAGRLSWFRDQGDLRRAIIWAEVLGEPVSRRLRRKRASMHTGRR